MGERKGPWGGKIVQLVRLLLQNPEDLILISGTHMVEGEKSSLKVVLHTCAMAHSPIHIHTKKEQTNKCNYFLKRKSRGCIRLRTI